MARPSRPTATSPQRRRSRDAERTRAAILQAAREVFLLGDYHQASLSDIARRAGVTQSLIHHHFGSKKGLYISAMGGLLTDLDEGLKGVVEPGIARPVDGGAFIASAVEGYFRFLAGNEQCVRLYRILDLSLNNDPELVAGMAELDAQGREMSSLHLIRAAHERLADMKARGLLRPGVEPLPRLSVVLCVVEHWFTSWRRLNHRLSQAVGKPAAQAGPGAPQGHADACVPDEQFLSTVIEVLIRGAVADPQSLPADVAGKS